MSFSEGRSRFQYRKLRPSTLMPPTSLVGTATGMAGPTAARSTPPSSTRSRKARTARSDSSVQKVSVSKVCTCPVIWLVTATAATMRPSEASPASAGPHHQKDGGCVRQHEEQPGQRDRDPRPSISPGDVLPAGIPLRPVPAPQLACQPEEAGLAAGRGRGGEREQMTGQPGPGRGALHGLTALGVRRPGSQHRRDGEERQYREDGNDRGHQDGRGDQGQRGSGQPQQPVEGRPDVAPRAADHRRPVGAARTLVDLQRRRRANHVDELALDFVLDLLLQAKAGEIAGDEGALGEHHEDRRTQRKRRHAAGGMPARHLAEQSEQEREADPGGRFENRHRHHQQGPGPGRRVVRP